MLSRANELRQEAATQAQPLTASAPTGLRNSQPKPGSVILIGQILQTLLMKVMM